MNSNDIEFLEEKCRNVVKVKTKTIEQYLAVQCNMNLMNTYAWFVLECVIWLETLAKMATKYRLFLKL